MERNTNRDYNSSALKYAGAQLLSSNRNGVGYDSTQWEAKDIKKNSYGDYEYDDPSTRLSTFQNSKPYRNAVADTLDDFQSNFGSTTKREYANEIEDMQNYSTGRSNVYGKTLTSSMSLPLINGTASGFPSNAFLTPYFMQIQHPVAQLDMDWYIRQ